MSAIFLAFLLYARAAAAAPNPDTGTRLLSSGVLDEFLKLRQEGAGPQVEVPGELWSSEAGVRVRNIEGVTGAVLVKSRIIDKSGTDVRAKSLDGSSDDRKNAQERQGKAVNRGKDSPDGNQTQILLTFLQPVKENGKSNFFDRAATKSPSLMKIVAGESDFQVEYLETEDTGPLSLFKVAGAKKRFQDSLDTSQPPLKIPGRVPTHSEKLATFHAAKNTNENNLSLSKLSDDEFPDFVESGLIKVKSQPPPEEDPDIIHISQTLQEIITVTRTVPSVVETVTNTITETTTHADRRPISEVVTQVLTITSVTVTTTTKTETSVVPATPTTALETMTMPPMQRPTKGTFLSRMPPRTSTADTVSTSIQPTSVVEPSVETSLLDPTDPDFFLPLNLRDRGTDNQSNVQMEDSNEPNVNVQANITQIMMLKDQAQNGGSVNQTKLLLFNILKNMTNMTDTRLEALNEILKTPEDIAFFLQTLVKRISEITNDVKLNGSSGIDEDFAPIIRNTEDDPEEESIIPQDAVNTNVDVWPNGRGSSEQFVLTKFAPTIADPFRCRKKGVQYPITIDYNELRQRIDSGAIFLIDVRNSTELESTGRLPWSYNLPLGELYQAFKLQSSSFQTKFGFPKPKPESPIVTLTGAADGRAVQAWNLLQKFGYCNVKLYLGSYLDYIKNGGNLVPYFRPAEAAQSPNASNSNGRETGSSQRSFRFSLGAANDDDELLEVVTQNSGMFTDVDEVVVIEEHPRKGLRDARAVSSWNLEDEVDVQDEQRKLERDNASTRVESQASFGEAIQNGTENESVGVTHSSEINNKTFPAENDFKNDTQNLETILDDPTLFLDSNLTMVMGENESKLIREESLNDTLAENPTTIENSSIIEEISREADNRDTEQRLDNKENPPTIPTESSEPGGQGTEQRLDNNEDSSMIPTKSSDAGIEDTEQRLDNNEDSSLMPAKSSETSNQDTEQRLDAKEDTSLMPEKSNETGFQDTEQRLNNKENSSIMTAKSNETVNQDNEQRLDTKEDSSIIPAISSEASSQDTEQTLDNKEDSSLMPGKSSEASSQDTEQTLDNKEDSSLMPAKSRETGNQDTEQRLEEDDRTLADENTQFDSAVGRTNAHQQIRVAQLTKADNDSS